MQKRQIVTIQLDRRKIKSRAAYLDMTISSLARDLGISHTFLHDLIRNRRPATQQYAPLIAKILKVPLTDICQDEQRAA